MEVKDTITQGNKNQLRIFKVIIIIIQYAFIIIALNPMANGSKPQGPARLERLGKF
jgi:hypothetical protein